MKIFQCWKFELCRPKGCKVTGHQTLRMISPWAFSNLADWFEWGRGRLADFFLRPPTLTASNFEALWPTDFRLTAIKDLNLLKKRTKNQEAGSILKVSFALSKRPHFHRAYLVTIRMRMSTAVLSFPLKLSLFLLCSCKSIAVFASSSSWLFLKLAPSSFLQAALELA